MPRLGIVKKIALTKNNLLKIIASNKHKKIPPQKDIRTPTGTDWCAYIYLCWFLPGYHARCRTRHCWDNSNRTPDRSPRIRTGVRGVYHGLANVHLSTSQARSLVLFLWIFFHEKFFAKSTLRGLSERCCRSHFLQGNNKHRGNEGTGR